MKKSYAPCFMLAAMALASCTSAKYHQDQVSSGPSTISVGTVQQNIKVGMPASAVIEVLGAPNMVTTDENRNEVWAYDKISTDSSYSSGSAGGGVGAGGLIGATGLLGGLTGGMKAGAASTSQKTLTIVVKFDKDKKVSDFSYRQSKF